MDQLERKRLVRFEAANNLLLESMNTTLIQYLNAQRAYQQARAAYHYANLEFQRATEEAVNRPPELVIGEHGVGVPSSAMPSLP